MTTEPADDHILCIFCLQRKPRRKVGEHVAPFAIGGSFVIDRVCEACDNAMGSAIDAKLATEALVVERRAEFRLAGHSGAIPDPEAAACRRPLVSTVDPNLKILMRKTKSGKIAIKTLPHVDFEVVEVPGGRFVRPAAVYLDPTDVGQAEKLAKAALRAKGIEGTDADRIAREFAASLQLAQEVHEFVPTVPRRIGGHEDALLKMAYELSWHWLRDIWLDDPMAVAMRNKLIGRGSGATIRGKIYEDADVAVIPVWGDPGVLHVAYIHKFQGSLLVMIRLFDVWAVGLVVTDDAARYKFPVNNGLIMNVAQRKYEEAAFIVRPGDVAWTHDPTTSPIAETASAS